MPLRAIGRAALLHGTCVVFERAESAGQVRPGTKIAFAVDEHAEHLRVGWHDVEWSHVYTGSCGTRAPVRDITPAACVMDYVIVEVDEPWSPYP